MTRLIYDVMVSFLLGCNCMHATREPAGQEFSTIVVLESKKIQFMFDSYTLPSVTKV